MTIFAETRRTMARQRAFLPPAGGRRWQRSVTNGRQGIPCGRRTIHHPPLHALRWPLAVRMLIGLIGAAIPWGLLARVLRMG